MRDLLSVFSVGVVDTPRYALGLAKATGARLTTLMVNGESIGPIPQLERLRGDVVEVSTASTSSSLFGNTAECVMTAAKQIGVECSVSSISSDSPNFREVLVGTAQVRDLIVFDVQGPLQNPMLDWVEAVLFGSGRPIVLAPPEARPVLDGIIVFAWDESRSAIRVLSDILPLITGSRDVVVVSVVDDKQTRNAGSGEWICSYLGKWGIKARFHQITPRNKKVGTDLLGFAKRINADALAMGGFGHSREREFILGSATRDVFESRLNIPVFLSH